MCEAFDFQIFDVRHLLNSSCGPPMPRIGMGGGFYTSSSTSVLRGPRGPRLGISFCRPVSLDLDQAAELMFAALGFVGVDEVHGDLKHSAAGCVGASVAGACVGLP